MPDVTRSQADINCGINTDGDLTSQMANLETNANLSKHHQHHDDSFSCTSSSSSSSSSVSSSARDAIMIEPELTTTTAASVSTGAAESETGCESNNMNTSNSKTLVNEQCSSAATISNTPLIDQDSSGGDWETVENTTVDSLFGQTKTILKEDGLKEIIIPVPVLQRPPPCAGSGSGHSGSKVKSHNGYSAFKSGNQQTRKRPVLVRKATPIKIETPGKVLKDKAKQMSRENSFAEEEETEGVSA